jgi:hypothetical protein
MIRTVLFFAAMLGIWPNAADAATTSDAELLAEHLLLAIGGRPAWAGVTSTVLYSDQYRKSDGTAVGAVSMSDYERSRLRIDTTGANLQQIRIVDSTGDRSWRVDRQGRLEKVAEDSMARDLRRYTGHVYRTLQRIAARDPKLSLATGRNGSLEVHEGGTRIAWYLVDTRGEPYAMGAYDDNIGVICGPWELEKRGVRYPMWMSRPDGSWRVTLKSLAVNARIDEELFTPALAADQ